MREELTLTADGTARLDTFVSDSTELTRSAAQRLIRTGDILVDGRPQKAGYALSAGESVLVRLPEPAPIDAVPEDIPLSILYEDADIAVVDKPQGMVVHPAPGHATGTLVNALLYRLSGLSGIGGALRPGIVHRIDRMTSGLLVVAKNDAAHTALSAQFANRTAHRSYIGIVTGNLREDTGDVNAPIGRHPAERKKMAVVANGRAAVTHWRVLERYGAYTLLCFALETGRTHQIRVHMASIKHPLAGDEVYGSGGNPLCLAGQALHGYRLAFAHPISGQPMTFYAWPPDWFCRALTKAGSALTADTLMDTLRALDGVETPAAGGQEDGTRKDTEYETYF